LPFTYKEILNFRSEIFENIGSFLILGISSITIFNSIVYYSLNYTQVINGVLLISTIPVWIIVVSTILKVEKSNIYQIIGVSLSLLGVIFIITKADLNLILNLDFNKGDLSMVVAMFSWAIYSAFLKKQKFKISQFALLEIIIIIGLIFLAPVFLFELNQGKVIELNTSFFTILIYVVIFPSLLAYFFYIKGISIIGANRSGAFLHLMPIFGAIMALIIFNEKFMYYHFLGVICIIAGITLSNKKLKN
jgi:drug/metabolite transporter (DMT)-like permease